jgi:uncharacterized lipoprotein
MHIKNTRQYKMNIKIWVHTALILMVIALAGCTTQAWYDGAKQAAENNCRAQPSTEMERCLENLNKKSYDEYEKERANGK